MIQTGLLAPFVLNSNFCLIEKSEDLATSVSLLSFFVVHDTVGSGNNQETELSGGKDVVAPLFVIVELKVESGGDDTAFIDSAQKFNDDLATSVIIDDFEFTNVTVLLHNSEESQDDFGGRSDQNLFLALSFSIDDGSKAVG